jgi:predicted Holliday junction resolvase-like endonuclease
MFFLLLLLIVICLIFVGKYLWLQSKFETKLALQLSDFKEKEMLAYKDRCLKELEHFKQQALSSATQQAQIQLEQWKQENTKDIRQDARFIGSPIDFIVFDGLSEGYVKQIIFIEVKTNKSNLSQREKKIKEAILGGRVKWEEIRHTVSDPSYVDKTLDRLGLSHGK